MYYDDKPGRPVLNSFARFNRDIYTFRKAWQEHWIVLGQPLRDIRGIRTWLLTQRLLIVRLGVGNGACGLRYAQCFSQTNVVTVTLYARLPSDPSAPLYRLTKFQGTLYLRVRALE